MKKNALILLVVLLAACAAPDEVIGKDKEQAIRDFIAVRQLTEVDKIRSRPEDSLNDIEQHFLVYKARRQAYLVEFSRACYERDDRAITPDVRREANTIRSRFDTLRGCRIGQIYELTEAEVVELEDLGELPGSRN
jgi:hypothetical protein